MKKKTVNKLLAVTVIAAMTTSLAACGGSSKKEGGDKAAGTEAMDVTIDQIKLGEDYTDSDFHMEVHGTEHGYVYRSYHVRRFYTL